MRTKTHEKSQSHPLLQPESARSQIELDGLGLSRFHNAKMFVKGAAHRFQLTALAYDAHQMPAHGMPPLGQGLHRGLSSHRPPHPRTQWNKKGDRRTQKLTDKTNDDTEYLRYEIKKSHPFLSHIKRHIIWLKPLLQYL
jgi:hypothetical protein